MFLVYASKSSPAFLDNSDHKRLLFGLSYPCVFHYGCGYKNVPITFLFEMPPSFTVQLQIGFMVVKPFSEPCNS